MCARARLLFPSASTVNLSSSFWRVLWGAGGHSSATLHAHSVWTSRAVGRVPEHRSGTFSLVPKNLLFAKVWKDDPQQWECLSLGICALACDWLWNFGALGRKCGLINHACVAFECRKSLKFYICLNWIIICNFRCFFHFFVINYTQWETMILTFFECPVHWHSVHSQCCAIITTIHSHRLIVPNRSSVH